jgi:hypothetical protein
MAISFWEVVRIGTAAFLWTCAVVVVLLVLMSSGCAAEIGKIRQGPASQPVAMSGTADMFGQLTTQVESLRGDVAGWKASMAVKLADVKDESRRDAAAHQKALLAVAHTDQSSNDKWTMRLLAGGAVLAAISYPVGKLVWVILGAVGKRTVMRARA